MREGTILVLCVNTCVRKKKSIDCATIINFVIFGLLCEKPVRLEKKPANSQILIVSHLEQKYTPLLLLRLKVAKI